jgi:hypothetical protein
VGPWFLDHSELYEHRLWSTHAASRHVGPDVSPTPTHKGSWQRPYSSVSASVGWEGCDWEPSAELARRKTRPGFLPAVSVSYSPLSAFSLGCVCPTGVKPGSLAGAPVMSPWTQPDWSWNRPCGSGQQGAQQHPNLSTKGLSCSSADNPVRLTVSYLLLAQHSAPVERPWGSTPSQWTPGCAHLATSQGQADWPCCVPPWTEFRQQFFPIKEENISLLFLLLFLFLKRTF